METVTRIIGTGRERIELSFGRTSNGQYVGEAYFPKDDMLADIVNGEFVHPYYGTRYRMHVGRTLDVTLEVQVWRTVQTLMPN